jgi:hypothetical protein
VEDAQVAGRDAGGALQGRTIPSGFLAAMWFFSFQFNRNLLLTASPLKVHDVEQWAWMFARWAIAEASDMSKDSEFRQNARLAIRRMRASAIRRFGDSVIPKDQRVSI